MNTDIKSEEVYLLENNSERWLADISLSSEVIDGVTLYKVFLSHEGGSGVYLFSSPHLSAAQQFYDSLFSGLDIVKK